MALIKFVAHDEMTMDGNVRQVEDHQLYKEQEYESGHKIEGLVHNDVKYA